MEEQHGTSAPRGMPAEDARVIAGQIGSDRVSPGKVVCRCRHGCPVLIIMGEGEEDALRDDAGVPYGRAADLLWLTCPFLHEAIHGLETRGYVRIIGSYLEGAGGLSVGEEASREDFIALRRASFPRLLSREDDPPREAIAASGVGGRRCGKGLKCLHAHFAHFLFNGNNIAGHITFRLLGDALECDDARCRRFR